MAAIGASRPLARVQAKVPFLNTTAVHKACRREPLLMAHICRWQYVSGPAQLGGKWHTPYLGEQISV